MGISAPIYTYRNQLYLGVSVAYFRRGLNPDLGITVGAEPNQKVLLLARGSMVSKAKVRDAEISFVDYGYLFDSFGGEKSLISLSKKLIGDIYDSAIVVFRKPDNFEGEVVYELVGGGELNIILSGLRERFNEVMLVLPSKKILKVSLIKNQETSNLYFYFNGKILSNLNFLERFLLKFRSKIS